MNNRREIIFDTDREPGNYVSGVLNSGVCSYILPASLINSDDEKWAVYNLEGYSRLKNYRNLSACNALSIVSLIIQAMEACKDYLIYPDQYQLSVDMIYIDAKMEKVKLLYSPAEKAKAGQLKNLIGQLKMQCTSGGEIYLEALEDLICKEGMKFGAVLALIESLKEEALLCQV